MSINITMCSAQWESLAEIYFNQTGYKDDENYIYCLCSRVFCRNNFDVLISNLDYDEDVKNEAICETHVHFSLDSVKGNEKDLENLSCYCSASHTDNYCSTDEHDTPVVSVLTSRFCKDIQSSDSGADLSEYGFQDSPRFAEVNKTESQNGIDAILEIEPVDQTHDGLCSRSDMNTVSETNYLDCCTWERYWSVNGERLIWASWIEKYSEYINPQYAKNDAEKYINFLSTEDIVSGNSSSFKNKCVDFVNCKENLAIEPVLYPNSNCVITVEEGWNNLNASDYEDTWNGPRQSDQDHLLSPRCPSSNSIPNTIGTTDSMTNVTQMTVSSYELNSSTVSSESSKESSEAAISGDSHGSGPWSENLGSLSAPEYDDTMDPDQYWQILWKKHFEELYAKHYALYLSEHMLEKINEKTPAMNEGNSNAPGSKKKKNKQRNCRYLNSVGALLQNFSATKICDVDTNSDLKKFPQGYSKKNSILDNVELMNSSEDSKIYSHNMEVLCSADGFLSESQMDSDESEMAESEIIPNSSSTENKQCDSNISARCGTNNVSHGFSSQSGDQDPPKDNRPISLKRSHESDNEEPNLDKAKAAFSLMGFAFSEDSDDKSTPLTTGEVVYRKRNIRLQNRYLKMKHNKSFNNADVKPTHVYFDDQGNSSSKLSNVRTQSKDTNILHYNSSSDEESAANINEKSPLHIVYNNDLESRVKPETNCCTTVSNSCDTINETNSKEEIKSVSRIERKCGINNSEDFQIAELDEVRTCDRGPSILITTVEELQNFQKDTINKVDKGEANKSRREKKKRRKPKRNLNVPAEIANDKNLIKYWYKRYSLFSKFDQGIHLDTESWYSVTPEKVAAHTAQRCRADVIIDAFCGAGGNAIQFAFTCERVIAIDIDPEKISIAQHNAIIYGVADRIEFIVGDFLNMSHNLIADVVFLSPPWGGPQYLKDESYDIEKNLCPVPASRLINEARKITQNIALFLPRNTNANQLVLMAGPGGSVEIEQNFLDKKLIAVTAYYGELLNE